MLDLISKIRCMFRDSLGAFRCVFEQKTLSYGLCLQIGSQEIVPTLLKIVYWDVKHKHNSTNGISVGIGFNDFTNVRLNVFALSICTNTFQRFMFIQKMRRFPNRAFHYATIRQSASPGTAGEGARFDSLRPSH